MSAEQLYLFNTELYENFSVRCEMKELREAQSNLRRGLFGRFDEVKKALEKVETRLDLLELKCLKESE